MDDLVKVVITEARAYGGIGAKVPGDIVEVSGDYAEQLIRQGYAQPVREARSGANRSNAEGGE